MTKATLLVCVLVAFFEGLDIQSMGVAAPGLATALGFGPSELGMLMSASSVGLMIGAAAGGSLSDRIGRRFALMLAMALLGCFSLATAAAGTFGTLLAARLLAGLGLGGAFPNLIAVTADAPGDGRRATTLSIVYCGLPAGGMLAGMLAGGGFAAGWRTVFLVGGIGPLLLVPLIALVLPRASPSPVRGSAQVRFPIGREGATVLLWLCYLLTLGIVYALLNWLPSLMIARGLPRTAAGGLAVTLNLGAVAGSLVLGWCLERWPTLRVLVATYGGMAAAMAALAMAPPVLVSAACFAAGFFVIGGQLVLYALAPQLYPPAVRGAGIGAAVAVGRLGAILGPVALGLALADGLAATRAPLYATPLLAVALVAAAGSACAVRSGA